MKISKTKFMRVISTLIKVLLIAAPLFIDGPHWAIILGTDNLCLQEIASAYLLYALAMLASIVLPANNNS